MKLSFILEQAKTSELKSLSTKAMIDKTIVAHLNMALIALYGRFTLKTQEAIITLRPDIAKTIYTINSSDSDVRVNGGPVPDGSFMSAILAYNEDGTAISINKNNDALSIFSVTYNSFQVPLLEQNSYVSLIYKANPDLIVFQDDGNGHAVDTDVDIPLQLLEPLLQYIAYRAFVPVSGEGSKTESAYLTGYIKACSEVERLGLLTPESLNDRTVDQQGFL